MNKLSHTVFLLLLPLAFVVMGVIAVSTAVAAPSAETYLLTYALAFDNDSLTQQYTQTVDIIAQATDGADHITVTLLVDIDETQYPFTDRLLVIHDGTVQAYTGRPLPDGTEVGTEETEYNMLDSVLLGNFIQWSRQQVAADYTVFSYVGHGTFAPPLSDLSPLFDADQTEQLIQSTESIFPLPFKPTALPFKPTALPFKPTALPDFSDNHTIGGQFSPGLITPHILQEALAIGTDDGANPLAVVDLFHCFSGSIEELYQLSNPDGTPYASVMIGAANYHYFFPDMVGQAIDALANSVLPPADALVEQYDTALWENDYTNNFPTVYNPRSLIVVQSNRLEAIKTAVDSLASLLVGAIEADPDPAVTKIADAHAQAGVYYDTSFCENTFAINKEDGLVDIGSFSYTLAQQFADDPAVRQAALAVNAAAEAAVLSRQYANGVPWFADQAPSWQFSGNAAAGISIMGDFHGIETAPDHYTLSWHTSFYTHTLPNPLAFTQPTINNNDNAHSWADLLHRYWEVRVSNGVSITTEACLPTFLEPGLPFDAPLVYPTGTSGGDWVFVNDANDDGTADILLQTTAEQTSTHHQFIQDPAGVLTYTGVTFTFSEIALTLPDILTNTADFDGDGLPDTLRLTVGDQQLSLVLTDGADQSLPIPNGATAVVTGDFNRNGRLDIVTLHPDTIAYMQQRDDGTFAPYRTGVVPAHSSHPAAMAAADVTADGYDDLLLAGSDGWLILLAQSNNAQTSASDTFVPLAVAVQTVSSSVTAVGWYALLGMATLVSLTAAFKTKQIQERPGR